jgi:Leucine Rich repeat
MQIEPPKADPPKRKRRWFQFSMRTLLIFTLICAIGSAWVARTMERKRKEREAVKAIVSLGGQVFYDYQIAWYAPELREWFRDARRESEPTGPLWLRRWLGNDVFSDAVFARLNSDAGMKYLADLSNLQNLNFTNPTLISDKQLKHVQKLSDLRKLDLGGTKVTDAGIADLVELRQLETLNLAGSRITDAALSSVKRLIRLKCLDLGYTGVTSDGLDNLKDLTQLETLALGKTAVGDAGLQHLSGLTRLGDLSLYGTIVGDAGLAHLKGMFQLRTLDLRETKVTDAGVNDLQRALPKCQIEH